MKELQINTEKFLQEDLKDHHQNLTDLIIQKMEELEQEKTK